MNEVAHADTDREAVHAAEARGEHGHPDSRAYIRIALILAVLTAIEVAIYYFELDKRLLAGALIVLAVAKFTLVAAYFMHLKFDSKLFTGFFVGGLIGTMGAFVAMLSIFRVLF